jgi:hypothetical protein
MAKKIAETKYTSTIDLKTSLEEAGLPAVIDPSDGERVDKVEVTKTGLSVFTQMHRRGLDPGMQQRVDYVWENFERFNLLPEDLIGT